MSLSAKIREQIINSFRAELAEHVQTMNNGLLALEQQTIVGAQREERLAEIFRAAHSLKGAARAVGVSAVEQLAHVLEDVLGGIQQNRIQPTPDLFTACYKALDAIQGVQAAYEAGQTTPPLEALQALGGLTPFVKAATENPAANETAQAAPAAASASSASPANGAANGIPPARPAARKSARRANEGLAQEAVAALFHEPGAENESQAASEASATNKAPATLVEPVAAATPAGESSAPPVPPTPPQVEAEASGKENDRASAPGEVAKAAQTASPASSAPAARQPAAQPPSVSPAPAAASQDETIRVPVSKLDALMAQLSELLITKIHAEQRLAQVRQAQEFMSQWQKEWLAVRSSYSHLARHRNTTESSLDMAQRKELARLLNYINDSQDRLREMGALINDLSHQYNSDTMQMSLVIDGLEEEIKRVRMLPLSTVTGSFGRMMRDLAQVSGKDVSFEVIGSNVELDKRVLEQIKDPLIHLLRNAVDHGIEPPAQRMAEGKPPQGKITLEARHVGKDVSLTVSDDGAGLNIASICQVAIRRNIPNAQTMTDAEIVDLIYNPGFSTSPIITDLSGRGVGLDVVRRNVETLSGRIAVEWTVGAGSRFTLTLPLALTSSRALLVRVSGQQFAIPLNAIERIEHLRMEEIISMGGHDTVSYNGRPLMLVHLSDVLNLPPAGRSSESDGRIPVVILAAAERKMAFAVDELADEQEVVMKGLGRQLTRVGGIAGASVMGSGEVLLILNVADLVKLAQRGARRSVLEQTAPVETEQQDERPKRRILVVDDSITTRTLEKNILEAAGFNVRIAMDGMEALNTVATGELPDLIISDVSMPRLDGLGLAQRIKSDQRTSNIPFILVTSLDSPEDKARGIEVGADAYIVKSSFDQNNLLETIEQLI